MPSCRPLQADAGRPEGAQALDLEDLTDKFDFITMYKEMDSYWATAGLKCWRNRVNSR